MSEQSDDPGATAKTPESGPEETAAGARKRRNLGRGLAALFGDEEGEGQTEAAPGGAAPGGPRRVPIAMLRANPFQPRQDFDEEQLAALVESIRAQGVLQPILVRPAADQGDAFEIVAGERRWRAAQRAQLHDVPVMVKQLDDRAALEVALVENIQRQDLSPLEEAEGYQRLIAEFNHTQENLAQAIGRSRSHIANTLRLLNLPDAVKALLRGGDLSAGHARALLGAEAPEDLAKKVVRRGLNVRQTERLVQREKAGSGAAGSKPTVAPASKDSNTRALEAHLSEKLGLKVAIDFDGRGGKLTVYYQSLEQLDEVVQRLGRAGGDLDD